MHGSGFILMSADADDAMNRSIHQAVGCKVVSIDYSLAPEHPFPAAVDEIYAVVKEIHKNAVKYDIDPKRMAIGGHSAGGNLATATCIQANRKKEFRFVCQIFDYPSLDLAPALTTSPAPREPSSQKPPPPMMPAISRRSRQKIHWCRRCTQAGSTWPVCRPR